METQKNSIMQQDRELDLKIWVWVAIAGLLFALINVFSIRTEAARNGLPAPSLAPWVWEASSLVSLVVIFPLVVYWTRRIPFTAKNWHKALLFHFLGSIGFSALHVTLMVVIRKLVYLLFFDTSYQFFGQVIVESLYEYRKDLGSYFLIVTTIIAAHALAQQARELVRVNARAKQTGQFTLKSGTRSIHLNVDDFLYAEAAGNYVQVSTYSGKHFVRSSLLALEEQLSAAGLNVRRIHRMYLVNANAIGEMTAAGSGDMIITLKEGTKLRASRRYRNQLLN
ncbi:MAG: LytTR family transcriptional regulator [Robiginitomaculum sp.]|nr:LytTR family transcriptional regulator [Robiginitomaculum sp.]